MSSRYEIVRCSEFDSFKNHRGKWVAQVIGVLWRIFDRQKDESIGDSFTSEEEARRELQEILKGKKVRK